MLEKEDCFKKHHQYREGLSKEEIEDERKHQRIKHNKEGTERVLNPFEYYEFLKALEPKKAKDGTIPNIGVYNRQLKKKRSVETAFMTGLRLQELVHLSNHPEWVDKERSCINLPAEFTKTGMKRKSFVNRNFVKELELNILSGLWYPTRTVKKVETKNGRRRTITKKIPQYSAWNQWYKRIAIKAKLKNPCELKAKISRKSWESWLVKAGFYDSVIFMSQGHQNNIAMKHYLNLDFTEEEVLETVKLTDTWAGHFARTARDLSNWKK